MPNAYSFAFITDSKDLYTLGYNSYYNLGNGNTSSTMQKIAVNSGKWKSISMGYHHSVGLDVEGYAWGAGYPSHYSLSSDTSNYYTRFTKLNGIKWKFINAGYVWTTAIHENGSLWVWGTSSNYCIPTTQHTPYMLDSSRDWKEVSTGYYHSVGIKNDGSLWAWGYNGYGQLGNGSYTSTYYPQKIGVANDWKTVSCGGYQTIAIKKDGTVYSWGYNGYGQLGTGNTSTYILPQKVNFNGKAKSVSMGERHALLLNEDGDVYGTGEGANHRLGNGSTSNRSTFIKVNTTYKFNSISAQYGTSYGITTDFKVTVWGYAGHYQSFGSSTQYAYPTIWNNGGLNKVIQLSDNSKYAGLKSLFYFNGKYHRWIERTESVDSYSNAIPEMTNNNAPYGTASSSDGTAWYAFSAGNGSYWYATDNRYPHYIQYRFEEPTCIDRISVETGYISGVQTGLRDFEFYGSDDGITFTLLQSGTHANNTDTQYHSINNNKKYVFYRLVGKSSYYSSRTYYIYIKYIQMFRKKEIATPEHWEEVSHQLPIKETFDKFSQYTEEVVYQRDTLLPQVEAPLKRSYNKFSAYSKKISLKEQKHLNIKNIVFETEKRI